MPFFFKHRSSVFFLFNQNEKTRRRLEEAQAQKYHKERYGTWK